MKKILRLVLWFVASLLVLAGWMLAEGGIFGQPGIWIIDANDNQYLKAIGAMIGIILSFAGIYVSLIPISILIVNKKHQISSH